MDEYKKQIDVIFDKMDNKEISISEGHNRIMKIFKELYQYKIKYDRKFLKRGYGI